MKVDKKLVVQLLYHVCKLNCEDEQVKQVQESLKEFANQFHRIDKCGTIK